MLILTAFLISVKANAYDYLVDGICYNLLSSINKTVSVTYRSSSGSSYKGDIIIPQTIVVGGNSYTVTCVGTRAFYNCSDLISVSLPNTIVSIEDEAFYFCSSLENVNIPTSLTSINEYAFYYCISLKSIELPNSLKSIGDCAFRYCSNLASIYIPKAVTNIGNYVFADCCGISKFTVDEENANYDSRENCNALIDSKRDILIAGTSGTERIPDTVVGIGDMAFNNMANLVSVLIPASVQSIGTMAFANCSNLTDIVIPNSVQNIGNDAFEHCTKLSSAVLPNSIKDIPDEMFYDCQQLKYIIIPSSIIKIGRSAFSGCINLESIIIPASVKQISSYAFRSCKKLSNVTLYTEGAPLSIEWSVFANCNLSSATLRVRRRYSSLYYETYKWREFGTIRPFAPIPGDSDSNELVNVDDLKLLSSYLIGKEVEYIDLEALDLDDSNSISICDLTLLVKMLQNK